MGPAAIRSGVPHRGHLRRIHDFLDVLAGFLGADRAGRTLVDGGLYGRIRGALDRRAVRGTAPGPRYGLSRGLRPRSTWEAPSAARPRHPTPAPRPSASLAASAPSSRTARGS